MKNITSKATEVFNKIMADETLNLFEKLDDAYREMYILLIAAWLIDDSKEKVRLDRLWLSDEELQRLANYVGKTIFHWSFYAEGENDVFLNEYITHTCESKTMEEFERDYLCTGDELKTFWPNNRKY